MRATACALLLALLAPSLAGAATTLELSDPVVMRGAAVAEMPNGFVGSTATFTITAAKNGSGHVFLDTFPLTQVDMQGSARLAARVASQITGKPLDEYDLFFVIRSGSVQIGGPSAGATMTVGAIAALTGWGVRSDVLMTGTINPDGSIGPVGGVPEKAAAAADAGMRRFLYPAGEERAPLSSQPGTTVRMDAYCRDELGIECVAVPDIYAAVENMTDHAFVRPPVPENVTGEAFLAKLGPLSQELLDAARRLMAEAETELAAVSPGTARDPLEASLDEGRATLARAESAASNRTYYTAASLSFQASIAAHDVRERARLARAADFEATLAGIVDEASRDVERARATIEAARVDDSSDFESVGAAQTRLLEAESRLALARALVENRTEPSRAVYEAAYASERAATATWWLKLGEDAPRGETVEPDALAEAARDTITTSTEQIAYVEAVFGAAAVQGALEPARGRLAEAERAMDRGFHAAAMLNALEAQVRASNVLVFGSFGGVPEERIEATRVEAARAIAAARGRGLEPLLAESEYEFGLSLDDAAEKMAFLGLARVTANLAGLPDVFGAARGGTASRFQGDLPPLGVAPTWVAAAFAVGIAIGVGLGLTALMPREREARDVRVADAAPPAHPTLVEGPTWRP